MVASIREVSGKGTGTSTDTPVLLPTNLGTPKTPTTKDARRYLCEFLFDQRIIGTPRFVWKPVLEGIILWVRPAQSAEKYRSVRLEGNFPLLYYMTQQAKLPTGGLDIRVVPAMWYGEPALGDVLDGLTVVGHRRIGILSAYSQCSTMTIASVNDTICAWMQENHDHPQIRFSYSFPNDPHYIEVLIGAIKDSRSRNGWPDFEGDDHALLSYYSTPVPVHKTGDPHHSECLTTTETMRERLSLSTQEYVVTF